MKVLTCSSMTTKEKISFCQYHTLTYAHMHAHTHTYKCKFDICFFTIIEDIITLSVKCVYVCLFALTANGEL
jgi:hypothetical protein